MSQEFNTQRRDSSGRCEFLASVIIRWKLDRLQTVESAAEPSRPVWKLAKIKNVRGIQTVAHVCEVIAHALKRLDITWKGIRVLVRSGNEYTGFVCS